jgi:hypothetical protein
MKLIYRGTSYNYNPDSSRADNMGHPHKPAPRSDAPYTLTYRGQTYQVDPQAPHPEASSTPKTYALTYRGVTYQVYRDAQGVVSTVAQPGLAPQKRASVPNSIPQTYIAKIHQANLLQNVQRRLQVAQERGDKELIRMLEAELHQLMA